MNRAFRFPTTVMAAGPLLVKADAAPFSNGGFEETPVAPPEQVETFTPVPIANAKVCPGPPPVGRIIQGNNNSLCLGWVRPGPGVVTRARSSASYLPPVDGEHVIAFNSANTLTGAKLSRTFSVVPGADYTVKFSTGSMVGVGATQLTARVASGAGATLGSLVSGTPAGFSGWLPERSFTYLNSLAYWASTLTPAGIASLGGPSASGNTGPWNVAPCEPQSTFPAGTRWAWAAHAGWLNWNWDPGVANGGRGAVLTACTASGYIWGENIGWIHLGDGDPANGVRYRQSGSDHGVNQDGGGVLYGYAWSANAGWIYFGKHPNSRPTSGHWRKRNRRIRRDRLHRPPHPGFWHSGGNHIPQQCRGRKNHRHPRQPYPQFQ